MMGIGSYIRLAAGIGLLLLLGWALRLDALRAEWRDRFMTLRDDAGEVLASIRIAADNPELKWDNAADQVDELDKSLTGWKSQAEALSGTIDTMGAEAVRLRAENATLTAKVRALNARRNELIAQLDQDALDPGDVADCWAQIREVDASLNKLREEGF